MLNRIVAYSPCRISFLGGGTDVNPFALDHGGATLSTSINIRHKITFWKQHWELNPGLCEFDALATATQLSKERGSFYLDYVPQQDGGDLDLLYEIIRSYDFKDTFYFFEKFYGCQSSGLGSSASVSVCLIGVFNRWLGIKQTREEIAEKAWNMEVNLGWLSGKQDQYASAFGGFNLFEFNGDVRRTEIVTDKLPEFQDWLTLFHTGKTRTSSKIQKRLVDNMKAKTNIKYLKDLKKLVKPGLDCLLKADWFGFGELVDIGWGLKKQSNPMASNDKIDSIIAKAKDLGAIGCKMLGAGGNGDLLVIADPVKRDLIIDKLGLEHIDFSFDRNGLEVREV